jgi:hypothetical protein
MPHPENKLQASALFFAFSNAPTQISRQKRSFLHLKPITPPRGGHGGAVSDTPALAGAMGVPERQVNGAVRGTVRDVRVIGRRRSSFH